MQRRRRRIDAPALTVGTHSAGNTEQRIEEESDIDVVELSLPVPDGARYEDGVIGMTRSCWLSHRLVIEGECVEDRVVQRIPQRGEVRFAEFERRRELVLHLPHAVDEQLK